ncbi:MAG: SDR family NAD(P)-dependent oxidoreductase [Anaerolineales bacterium]|nr:SDR family NAD(P)-dependent oxidoreductase [Anaerolineales bacterium]
MDAKNKPTDRKVIMVTGGTSGIGKVGAMALAKHCVSLILVGRNVEKGAAAVEEIKRESDNPNVEFMSTDLSSQDEVRRLVEGFQKRHDRLDVLVNNAGAFFLRRKESVDGIEMTFALNHLGYFLLTHLLQDTIRASAPARIINTASGAHHDTVIDFDDLQARRKYRMYKRYAESKLANVLFTYELARRLEATEVAVNAFHPGFVATHIGENNGWFVRLVKPLINLRAGSPEEGADTLVYLAISPEVAGVTGKYFYKRKAVPSSPNSYDETLADRLWRVSAELTGIRD